ncbi:MAG: ABC transporter ATP-binding protein/permease [Pseudomonadota bacterium]|nr:ABC transporter ATP-binding protein/permease [Pseudomonadota bacterium]
MKLIRQLWYILTPQERMEGAFLLCAMVLGAFFETVTIGVVFPFIAVLKEPELLFKARHIRPLLSNLNISEPRELFFILGPALIALFAIKTGYLILLYRWLFRYAMKKHVNLARQLLAGYLSAPYTLHIQRNSAELIRVTTRSVEDFTSGFMVNLLIVLGELLVLGALTSLLMVVEPLATLGALVVLAVPTALVYRSTQHRLGASGRIAEQSFGLMIQWAEQAISGVKEIMITGRRSFFIDQHGYHVQRFTDSVRSLTFLSAVPRFAIDTLAVSGMVAIVAILLRRGQDLQSSLLLLGVFGLAAVRLIPSTSRMSSSLAQLRYRYASTEVIYQELLALQQRPAEPLPGSAEEQVSPIPFRRTLVIEHLSYSYPATRQPAIDDVSLEIPKGHWAAFIGPTGAGKTTLADLVLGLLVPSSGRILVDGRNLHDNLASWQRNIGYVPQTVYVIDDSVRRNVAFGVPEEEIDNERVWQALRAAQVDHLVRSMPGELNAIIGERGGRISGGERQRLGIARALYRDPEVLVIDEATANLDPGTEAAIVEVIGGLRGKKTIIIITHRLAFARNCDCIYMLAQGRLRNSGGYSDLLSREPTFLEFCGGASEAIAVDAASSV